MCYISLPDLRKWFSKMTLKGKISVAEIDIMFSFFIYVMARLPAIICSIARFLLLFFYPRYQGSRGVWKKLEENCRSDHYSGQSSNTKESCSSTPLNRCTSTETLIIIITRICHVPAKHANRMDARAHTSTLAECAPRIMTPRSQGFVGQSNESA